MISVLWCNDSYEQKTVLFIDCSDYQKSHKAKDNAELEFPTTKRCCELRALFLAEMAL